MEYPPSYMARMVVFLALLCNAISPPEECGGDWRIALELGDLQLLKSTFMYAKDRTPTCLLDQSPQRKLMANKHARSSIPYEAASVCFFTPWPLLPTLVV